MTTWTRTRDTPGVLLLSAKDARGLSLCIREMGRRAAKEGAHSHEPKVPEGALLAPGNLQKKWPQVRKLGVPQSTLERPRAVSAHAHYRESAAVPAPSRRAPRPQALTWPPSVQPSCGSETNAWLRAATAEVRARGDPVAGAGHWAV